MAGYYDKNKDYSLAIVNAKSEAEKAQLRQERQNKIDAMYGGSDPYKGSNDIMGTGSKGSTSSGSSSGGSASSGSSAAGLSAVDTAKSKAYQAAAKGDWDSAAQAVNEIAYAGGTNQHGNYDMTEANAYLLELQKQFGYDANKYYQKQYDSVYGSGAWDGGTGTGEPTYNDVSQELVNAYYNRDSEQTQTNADLLAGLANMAGISGSVGGTTPAVTGGIDSMTQYINDLYAQQLEADLAALKSAYDSNVAEAESQSDRIAEQYRTARNQAAAQNALEVQRMNEIGIAQGLNTGATGQMALAQNAAYQGNLGNLWAQEAQTQSDMDLLLAQLAQQYNGNVQQATAESNAQRIQALLEETVRQQEIAMQQQSSNREYALKLLANGIMPDAATLASAGISNDAANALTQQEITSTTNSVSTAKSGGSGYNNGGLTTEQVKQLQTALGVTADGLWGKNSASAAGGLSADEAWAKYGGMNASYFNAYGQAIMQQLAAGKSAAAVNTLDQIWNQLSDTQRATLQSALNKYGLSYQA